MKEVLFIVERSLGGTSAHLGACVDIFSALPLLCDESARVRRHLCRRPTQNDPLVRSPRKAPPRTTRLGIVGVTRSLRLLARFASGLPAGLIRIGPDMCILRGVPKAFTKLPTWRNFSTRSRSILRSTRRCS